MTTGDQPDTLSDLLEWRAQQSPNAVAIVLPDERATFDQLEQRARRHADVLRRLGVGPGETVGILLPASVDFVALMFATAKVGATAVLINARFKSRELRHVITNGDLRVVFTSSRNDVVDFPALVAEAFPSIDGADPLRLEPPEAPLLRSLIVLDGPAPVGFLTVDDVKAAPSSIGSDSDGVQPRTVGPDDIAMIMYTSGTTSAPKGAMLRHGALVHQAFAVPETRLMLTSDDVVWSPLPLFHIGGMCYVLQCIAAGCPVVHIPHFDADTALRQLIDEECTVALPAFETIWLQILDHPEFSTSALAAIRLVLAVGVPKRLEQMQARLPHAPMITTFGGTESTSHLSIALADDPPEIRMRTGGHPLDGIDVRIVDPDTGDKVARGSRGEILYRGWNRFVGYYNEPELTASVIDPEGWFHSGDLGTMDDDGRVTFVGRIKDMLKVGGENVAAAEIEAFLIDHPAVQIAQVVSAPDARYVEVPAAFVQLKAGATATEEELIDHCRGRISTFKVPRYVRFVEEWPMSGTKIKKFVLRERIAEELSELGITEAPKITSR